MENRDFMINFDEWNPSMTVGRVMPWNVKNAIKKSLEADISMVASITNDCHGDHSTQRIPLIVMETQVSHACHGSLSIFMVGV